MGKVPDTLPDEEGWKLNRTQYYQEGWLAGGNSKGVVGVTFTTSHCKKYDPPARSNFNLRGHRSEVSVNYCTFHLKFGANMWKKKQWLKRKLGDFLG